MQLFNQINLAKDPIDSVEHKITKIGNAFLKIKTNLINLISLIINKVE